MLNGGRDQCLTIGDDSFTTTGYEDHDSLDNIDKGSSSEDLKGSQGKRKKCQETSGEDSGEGSLSHSSSERNSTGYVSSVPLSDTTDTGDTVVFCGESGISGMSVGGSGQWSASNEGPLSAAGISGERGGNPSCTTSPSVSPQNHEIPQSRVTSSSCEDTCHDGGTCGHRSVDVAVPASTPPPSLSSSGQETLYTGSGIVLPHFQPSTSQFSQANLVNNDSSYGSGYTPVAPVMCNGSPCYNGNLNSEEIQPQLPQSQRRRHPAESSNGVLPQFRTTNNTVGTPAQENPLSHAGNHISHVLSRGVNSPREYTSSLLANSDDTSCARKPQVSKIHYNV